MTDEPTICWKSWDLERIGGHHRCMELAPHDGPHRCCCGATQPLEDPDA